VILFDEFTHPKTGRQSKPGPGRGVAGCQTSSLGICTASSRFLMKAVTPRKFLEPSMVLSLPFSAIFLYLMFSPSYLQGPSIFQDSGWLIGEPPEPSFHGSLPRDQFLTRSNPGDQAPGAVSPRTSPAPSFTSVLVSPGDVGRPGINGPRRLVSH